MTYRRLTVVGAYLLLYRGICILQNKARDEIASRYETRERIRYYF